MCMITVINCSAVAELLMDMTEVRNCSTVAQLGAIGSGYNKYKVCCQGNYIK